VTTKNLDISKKLWEISTENGIRLSELAIDDDIKTNWPVSKQILSKSKINLGKITNVIGFTYTPTQTRWVSGVITHYKFYGSIDGENWIKLSSGEFSNIIANPIQQKVIFKKSIPIKYIKLVADRIMGNKDKAIIAEIGIISNKQL
jgi:alpha-L-fucosidase